MGKLKEFLSKKPQSTTASAAVDSAPKLTIAFEWKTIEVNGITFRLLKSDADILDDAMRLIDESENLDTKDPKAVLKTLHDMAGYIDTVLGAGALKQISGGVPVGYKQMQECMGVIVQAVYAAYQTELASKYDD